ncbi:hypothetical protein ACTFIZ_004239 [Dictyostelium cf. discoideum]
MKLLILFILFILINNIFCLELVEIKYDNNNCEGKPEIIKFCNKDSRNGKVEIIGFNNKTGNKIITQTFGENKVYTNELNVCIPEGEISFYFILHEKKNHLSIPKIKNHEYCNEIQLLDDEKENREKQCDKHALIITYKNETCSSNNDKSGNPFKRILCDPKNGDVKRYLCKEDCQSDWSSCEFDKILQSPKSICPHFKQKSLKKLLKKKTK